MVIGAQCYVVCRNPIEARQDAADREALLAKLRHTLEQGGPKAVVGNRGYARYLKIAKDAVALDEAAIAREARLDGKFVLTTTTELSAAKTAKAYKSLWRVERAFRSLKSTLDVRPVFHHATTASSAISPAAFWRCASRSICNAGSTPRSWPPPGLI